MSVGRVVDIDTGPSPRGWHRLELVLRCPRLYAYDRAEKDALGPDAPPAESALARGSLWHAALAHRYARMKAAQEGADPGAYLAPEAAVHALAEKWRLAGSAVGVDARDDVLAAFRAYEARHALERLRVVAVEDLFETRIGGHPYTARLDLVVEDAAGMIRIVDHKTTWLPSSSFADALARYALSGQFLGQQIIGRERWGARFAGVVIGFASFALPHAFERRPLDPAPAALARFPDTVREAEERIARWSGLPPGAWPAVFAEQTCRTIYGACRFRHRCRWGN